MRRVSCVLIAFAAFVPSLARAQNFPDIPDNHWAYEIFLSSPRVFELSKILMDAGLINHRPNLFNSVVTDSNSAWAMRQELDNQMTLLRIYLGVVPRSEGEHGAEWLAGWHRHLPVVERIYTEWASNLKKPLDELTEMQKTIKVIKLRFAERGTPVDEHRFEPFSDLPCGHWANDAIIRMREIGVLRGYPDNTFRG